MSDYSPPTRKVISIDEDLAVLLGFIVFIIGLVVVIIIGAANVTTTNLDRQAKNAELLIACVQAGSTPVECDLLSVVPNQSS